MMHPVALDTSYYNQGGSSIAFTDDIVGVRIIPQTFWFRSTRHVADAHLLAVHPQCGCSIPGSVELRCEVCECCLE